MAQSMMKEAVASTVHALQLEASGEHGEQPTDSRTPPEQVSRMLDTWGETPQIGRAHV